MKIDFEQARRDYLAGRIGEAAFLSELAIVVIDDRKYNIKLIEETLYQMGAKNITSFLSPYDALDHIAKYRPDVILVDDEMPGLSGIEVFQAIREQDGKYFKRVPVVMVAGNPTYRAMTEANHIGISGVVAKPFSATEITTKIRVCVKEALKEASGA